MADSFPLLPVMNGGPAAPVEGATNSSPTAPDHPYEGGVADTFKSAYYSSPVVTALARGLGEANDPTPISYDAAKKQLVAQGLDPAFLAPNGNTLGAVRAEAERQSEVKLHQLRQDREGNNWSSSPGTQLAGSLTAAMVDPSNIVLGPVAGKIAALARGGLAARAAVGAGEGLAYNTGMSVGSDVEAGRDPDLSSWEFLRNSTIAAGTGGLLHAAFGARPIARPGMDMRGEPGLSVVEQLERSDAAAKVQGVDTDHVISPTGAVGRYQVEPATARGLGLEGTDAEITEQLKDPAVNKVMASKLLDQLARRYGNDPEAIAVAYNAGPARADKWLANGRDDKVLPGETRGYLGRLRGATMPDRTAAGATALAQFAADNPVDPGMAFTKRSALTIGDDHNEQVRSLESEALQNARPDPLKYSLSDGDQNNLDRVNSEAQQGAAEPKEEDHVNDFAQQADMLRENGGEAVKNAATEATNVHEEGTQMTHDEFTKAVQSAVNCGVVKGLSYGP
jgi:hypothetical protein